MEIVCHKDWGIGIVVKRENLENGNFVEVSEGGKYLTVLFDDGAERQFSIPASFKKGILTAEGDLGIEVANAVSADEAMLAKREAERTHAVSIQRPHEHRAVKTPAKITLTGDLKADFRTSLAASGYKPTVVYAYGHQVACVAEEEGLTLKDLLKNIASIVPMYDKGGIKQNRGAYQKDTTINALRRYQDFAISNPDALK